MQGVQNADLRQVRREKGGEAKGEMGRSGHHSIAKDVSQWLHIPVELTSSC